MRDGFEYVEAHDVRRSPFRVAITPLPSLGKTLRSAAGGGVAGTPQAWLDAISSHLRRSDYDTLAPFTRRGPMMVPDALMGFAKPPGESLADGIERMMATPADLLANEIADCSAYLRDGSWDAAAGDPTLWLRRYVAALLRAWKGFAPVWEQARATLDREVERIAIATARDAQLELLDGLLHHGAVRDGRWFLKCAFHEGRLRFPEDGFVLMPMLAAPGGSILTRDRDMLSSVCYPLGAAVVDTTAQVRQTPLQGLLGGPRAHILRETGRPTSIGDLAHSLSAVPSAATHHVKALESADLVTRDRHGRHIIVRRTVRGDALLQLYSEAPPRTAPPPAREKRPTDEYR